MGRLAIRCAKVDALPRSPRNDERARDFCRGTLARVEEGNAPFDRRGRKTLTLHDGADKPRLVGDQAALECALDETLDRRGTILGYEIADHALDIEQVCEWHARAIGKLYRIDLG